MIGTQFGRYTIQGELGQGGMGVVYLADDIRLHRKVALKILAPHLQLNPKGQRLIMREARYTAALNHPCICTVYEVGEEEGKAYIAMEYVDGCSLRRLLDREGLDPCLLAHISRLVIGTVGFAHTQGILHRDIKSSNVLVTGQGTVKMLDFGLAMQIPTDSVKTNNSSLASLKILDHLAGTIQYMAPEVLRGGHANEQTDIWSLGVLLYEMATGCPPFCGTTIFDLAVAVMTSQPVVPPSKIPPWAVRVITQCLERSPERRYRCVRDLLVDLPLEEAADGRIAVQVLASRFRRARASQSEFAACSAVA